MSTQSLKPASNTTKQENIRSGAQSNPYALVEDSSHGKYSREVEKSSIERAEIEAEHERLAQLSAFMEEALAD